MPQRTILRESEFRLFFFLTVKGVGVKSDNSRFPCASRGEVLISSSLWSFSIPKNLFLIGNSIRIPHYHCLFHSPVGKGTKAPLAGYLLLNGGNEYSLVLYGYLNPMKPLSIMLSTL